MILYVNGESNSAGAEAVNSCAFADDDPLYWAMGRKPHPDNLRASYGCEIANMIGAILECDAESAASNDRILRTTYEYIKHNTPNLIIIGWATWEREEWLHEGTYYQVTASGKDSLPEELHQKYQNWVIKQTHITREAKLIEWHKKIYQLHTELNDKNIPHVFFNCYTNFANIKTKKITTHNAEDPTLIQCFDWGLNYVEPYELDYMKWLKSKGFNTVTPDSWHFGADAHYAWAEFLYQNYVQKLLTAK